MMVSGVSAGVGGFALLASELRGASGQRVSGSGLSLLLLACWLVVCLPACSKQAERRSKQASPPNLLVVVLDTTRVDYFSCYGYARPTTPRIDQLAREGIRYERAYATDFWTLPSHASIVRPRTVT